MANSGQAHSLKKQGLLWKGRLLSDQEVRAIQAKHAEESRQRLVQLGRGAAESNEALPRATGVSRGQ